SGMRDIDHLEAEHVELSHELLEAVPIAVRALEDDAAALEQALHHGIHLKAAFVALLGAEREVLEIDEHGDRRLRVLSDVHAIRPLNARRDGPLRCIFVDAGAGPQGRTVVLGAARGPSYEPSSSTESTNEALLRAPRLLALSANHRA